MTHSNLEEDWETSDSSLSPYAQGPVFNDSLETRSCASTPAYDYPSTPEYDTPSSSDVDGNTDASSPFSYSHYNDFTPTPSPQPYSYGQTPAAQNTVATINPAAVVPAPSANLSIPVAPPAPAPAPRVPQGYFAYGALTPAHPGWHWVTVPPLYSSIQYQCEVDSTRFFEPPLPITWGKKLEEIAKETTNKDRLLVYDCQGNVLVQPNHPRPIDPHRPSFFQEERKMVHVCDRTSPNNECHPWHKVPLKNIRTGRYYVMVLKRIPQVVHVAVSNAPMQGWTMNTGAYDSQEESEEE